MIFQLRLDIHQDQYLAYYRGEVKTVIALDSRGIRVQFPASALQKFVTNNGVHGWFELQASNQGKFVALHRLSD